MNLGKWGIKFAILQIYTFEGGLVKVYFKQFEISQVLTL
jgi:hypothetical protein